MSVVTSTYTPFLVALVGSVSLTPMVIRLAHRLGAVALPRSDRWHQRPTALMGGIAIYLASMVAALLCLPRMLAPAGSLHPSWGGIGLAATLVFVLGLVDDRRSLSPRLKLVGQTGAACLLVMSGVEIQCGVPGWVSVPLTIFWVVGITNAVNLLDNMDGVVAGVVAVVSLMLAAYGIASGQGALTILALCLAGACCGFLLYNFHPARIFMGDCGSLYLGFSLSALALAGTTTTTRWEPGALVLPVALLAVPIFDTTLVSIARFRHGRPLSQGGRDHTTHRLVALGFSEPRVALFLYVGSGMLGTLAWAAMRLPILALIALAAVTVLVLWLFGSFLVRVRVYADGRQGKDLGERALARILLDIGLVPLAWLIAHLLRFDAAIPGPILVRAMGLLPPWIGVKIAVMVICRAHQRGGREVGMPDVVAALKASALASLVLIPVVELTGGFIDLSRSVLILDWIVFTALTLAVRVGVVVLQHGFAAARDSGETAVVGVGQRVMVADR